MLDSKRTFIVLWVMIGCIAVVLLLGVSSASAEPVATTTPGGFDVALYLGETSSGNMTVNNSGTTTLNWTTDVPVNVFDNFSAPVLGPLWTNATGVVVNSVGTNEPSEPYSMEINGATDVVETVAIDLAGYETATLEFYFERGGGAGNYPETVDHLDLYYKDENGTWNMLWQEFGTNANDVAYTQVVLGFPANAYHDDFKLRFNAMGSDGLYDYWYVDDFRLDYSQPYPAWIEFSPGSGNVTAGNETTVTVTANATAAGPGYHSTNISITTNDPNATLIYIPFNLTVYSAEHDVAVGGMEVPDNVDVGSLVKVNATIYNNGSELETLVNVTLYAKSVEVDNVTIASIPSMTSVQVSLNWTPAAEEMLDIEIIADNVTWENDTANNAGVRTVNAWAFPDIWVMPVPLNITAEAGTAASENLTIGNSGFADLTWAMNYTASWLLDSSTGGVITPGNDTNVTFTGNASALDPGTFLTTLNVSSDDPHEPVLYVQVNFTVLPAAHDLKLTSLAVPPTGYAEHEVLIDVEVFNQGTSAETGVVLELIVNGSVVNSTMSGNVDPGTYWAVPSLGWTPSAPGNYTVEASVTPVAGETYVSNNMMTANTTISIIPEIWVAPGGLDLIVTSGDTGSASVTIGNDGLGQLDWSIFMTNEIRDSFNTTILDAGLWEFTSGTPTINTAANNEPSPMYSLDLNGNTDAVTSVVFDLSNATEVAIEFEWQRGGTGNAPEAADHLDVEYLNDTGAWVLLAAYYGTGLLETTFNHGTSLFPPDALHAGFRFRLSAHGTSGNYDDFFIDDLLFRFKKGNTDWLQYDVLNGNLTTGRTTQVQVTVLAQNLSPGNYKTNITVENNDPLMGPQTIPVNLTVNQAPHDIAVTGMSHPATTIGGSPVNVTVTYTNLGFNDELDVAVRLHRNGTSDPVLASSVIGFIGTGTSVDVTFEVIPMSAGVWTLAAESVLVTGESISGNNVLTSAMTVTDEGNIAASVNSIELSTYTGGSDSASFTVSNSGLIDLNWDVQPLIGEYNVTEVAFNWLDGVTGGIDLGLGDDDFDTVSLPFEFYFYGQSFNQLHVCSNAWASFTFASGNIPGAMTFPLVGWSDVMALSGDDWNPATRGGVYVKNFTNPDRFVVTWNNISEFGGSLGNYFQLVLYSDGTIDFNYGEMPEASVGAVIGVNEGDGVHGTDYPGTLPSNTTLRWTNPLGQNNTLTATPAGGTVAPRDGVMVTLDLDASQFSAGNYITQLSIASDDPDTPLLTMPVYINITSMALPSEPRNLQAEMANTSVRLSWDAPTFDGNTAITGYEVYRGTNSGGESLLATVGAVTGYTDDDVSPNTGYYYYVRAVNVVGDGPASTEVSIDVPAFPPGAPATLVATYKDGKIMLSWSVPTDNGGAAITGYSIYRTEKGSQELLVGTAAVEEYLDADVVPGNEYTYTVAAENSAGLGPKSVEMSISIPAPGVDSDNDGLPDEWELSQFGDLSHDGTEDSDGDGFTDKQEYDSGTDPTNAASMPSTGIGGIASNVWIIALLAIAGVGAVVAVLVLVRMRGGKAQQPPPPQPPQQYQPPPQQQYQAQPPQQYQQPPPQQYQQPPPQQYQQPPQQPPQQYQQQPPQQYQPPPQQPPQQYQPPSQQQYQPPPQQPPQQPAPQPAPGRPPAEYQPYSRQDYQPYQPPPAQAQETVAPKKVEGPNTGE